MPSQIRRYVKRRLLEEKGLSGYHGKNRYLLGTEQELFIERYITQLRKGFIQTKFAKTQQQIGTRAWLNKRRNNIRTSREALKETSNYVRRQQLNVRKELMSINNRIRLLTKKGK